MKFLCWKFSIPPKKKFKNSEKFFIKSSYHKRKKEKKYPSHTAKIIFEKLKNPTNLFWKTTKLFLPMPSKKQRFELVPITKINSPISILKKNLLWKGVELPHPPSSPKKNPCKKNPNPLSCFLKAPFITCNYFNLIELSTLYTYWNPIINKKANPCKRGKKNFNSFALPKFSPINRIVSPPNFIN